ncbi:uncharacterized protein PITG_05988 [Phytophthora infestans T30-4]|uniref:Uncharacterized protein n=1 Tax=Phytophthora infestans (strain T30-4) TaxID=403677 RepID=D0N659_PHYIT|nr:uncharacterized protein PITG_05988 [Phytophthora infestans T30-4]EEY70550.1 hypothetical protein PITG_05988 [Phytophthora infestans T30-4]|eukprot:XP_002998204.1 hypothetical protein PITG_05988 [Phytophthora infestans T30-4]
MTAVALDENNRPYRQLPELVDASDAKRIDRLREIALQRKSMSLRRKKMEKFWSEKAPVKDTIVALSTSFLPCHLNRNGTVFGGEILSWMVPTKRRCTAVEFSQETATW